MPELENVQAPVTEQPVSEAPVTTEQPTPEIAPVETFIEAGGKRFSNAEELAKAYDNSQSSMTQAQQESAQLRAVKQEWDQFGDYLDG